ncbi:50S ribosomal protein L18 [Candidatus Photodesmus blepharus]|uniref:Large ribosomal subunit protein uL18 n=1 Tax=Candidatus Photodesmus blepharonis TaxID=1179155 RepID=A0A084CM60_9GAMM|nr:50S ribosomal protein L18 [Candidatus Photodesmus blepharus]KEY90889.1 50S ribosomal protein L18 [Candidatus Photodesmus blepharus]
MDKKVSRIRRAMRTRCKIAKLGEIRLVVHRASRHVYAQIIAPNGSDVIAAASTVERAIRRSVKNTGNIEAAKVVGRIIAERALERGISSISFDRSGFRYHGRIAALAESAREVGLKF